MAKHFELESFLKYIKDDKQKKIIDQEKKISELTENINQLNTIVNAQAEEIHKLMESNQLIQSLKEQIDRFEKKYDSLQNEFNQFKERKCNDLNIPSAIGTAGQVLAVNQDENALSYHEYQCLDICNVKRTFQDGTDLSTITNPGTYWLYNGGTAINRPNAITHNSFRLVIKQLNTECIEQCSEQSNTINNFIWNGEWYLRCMCVLHLQLVLILLLEL